MTLFFLAGQGFEACFGEELKGVYEELWGSAFALAVWLMGPKC